MPLNRGEIVVIVSGGALIVSVKVFVLSAESRQ